MREYTLKPLSRAEQLYAYKQSQQIAGQTGYYGYLHGNFDKNNTFNNVFEYYSGAVVREHFDEERNNVIDFLENDICSSLRKMRDYCYSHKKDAAFKGNFGEEYGFRIDAGNQTLIVRFNPFPEGDYNCYLFAYDKHLLDRHIKKASKDIRFISSDYKPMFNLEDGDCIMIKYPDGFKKLQICRFIDEYHTQIGNSIYHICQFAELMEKNDATVIPMRSSLPETAYHYLRDSKIIEVIVQGNDKPYELNAPYSDDKRNMEEVDKLNAENNVSKKQLGAMIVGSILGWEKPEADPRNYDDNGKFIKSTRNKDSFER